MSLIETLNLTPEEVEQIVVEYCRTALRSRLHRRTPSDDDGKKKPPLTELIFELIASKPNRQCRHGWISHRYHHFTQEQRLTAIAELLKEGRIKKRTVKCRNNKRVNIYYIPEQD
ncbi:MAG: hypothetical protein IJH67_08140 [Thermoguttaceae bacterium]|nr:hypothetical protein [Thermoguttaceae bacterium]